MKVALLFLIGVNFVLAAQDMQVADKNFLKKQKQLLTLLEYNAQFNHDQGDYANTYNPQADKNNYKEPQVVEEFMNSYHNNTLLSKDQVYDPLCYLQFQQAEQLFEVFYFAKDFQTFFKAAKYFQPRVNYGMYVASLIAAVYQRQDCQGLRLPPVEEVFPQLFFNAQLIKDAQNSKQRGVNSAVFLANYTGNYPNFNTYDAAQEDNQINNYPYQFHDDNHHNAFYYDNDDRESHLSYFREDSGFNAFAMKFASQYPYFYNSSRYGKQDKSMYYGVRFFTFLRQILARYNLERFSNYLSSVRPINFYKRVNPGYNPQMQFANGQNFPPRPDHFDFQDYRNKDFKLVEELEKRFRDAVDSGFVYGENGRKIELTAENGADILGKLVVSHHDAVSEHYYGFKEHSFGYYQIARRLISKAADSEYEYGVPNGAVGYESTKFRDPVYYQLVARIVKLYEQFKNKYEPYKQDEIFFADAKILSVDIDKLITYFEPFETDLLNAIAYSPQENSKKYNYKARQLRLNCKPFNYHIKVNSKKDVEASVKVFIGPKYNPQGQEYSLQQARKYFYQIDHFRYTLKSGDNMIDRNIQQNLMYLVGEEPSSQTLYDKVNQAEQGGATFYYNKYSQDAHIFPARLVLPRGHKNGYPLVFFVIVNEYRPSKVYSQEYANAFEFDSKAYGFPFDRRIQEQDFQNAPNAFFKDVKVFQKKFSEVNQ